MVIFRANELSVSSVSFVNDTATDTGAFGSAAISSRTTSQSATITFSSSSLTGCATAQSATVIVSSWLGSVAATDTFSGTPTTSTMLSAMVHVDGSHTLASRK